MVKSILVVAGTATPVMGTEIPRVGDLYPV